MNGSPTYPRFSPPLLRTLLTTSLFSSECFKTWNDNVNACNVATDWVGVPTEPTDDNAKGRAIVCATPACQKLFSVFRSLIDTKCPGALYLAERYPHGMQTTEWCSLATAPSLTTPSPTIPSPVVVPAPVMPAVVEKVDKVPLYHGGIVALVLVVVATVAFFVWRRYCRRIRTRGSKCCDDGFAYGEYTSEGSHTDLSVAHLAIGPLNEGLETVRIPFEMIRFEGVLSASETREVTRGVYNNQEVAIKRLPPGRRKDATSIQNFFAEIQLTSSLEHECIVQFVGVAWASLSDLCMVSEFMPGGDLRALLARYAENGHPNGHDNDKLKIAIQVAHALTYLHTLSTPVVHRDLKSRNILLSSEGDAKIMDFGISCERRDVTMTAGVGTTLWMAPEVMLGQRYDEKADVFSFGVILSELDTHAMPYDHARDPGSDRLVADTVLMHLVSEGKLRPRFSNATDPKIVELGNDCLQLDPAARPLASEILFRIHECRENNRVKALG